MGLEYLLPKPDHGSSGERKSDWSINAGNKPVAWMCKPTIAGPRRLPPSNKGGSVPKTMTLMRQGNASADGSATWRADNEFALLCWQAMGSTPRLRYSPSENRPAVPRHGTPHRRRYPFRPICRKPDDPTSTGFAGLPVSAKPLRPSCRFTPLSYCPRIRSRPFDERVIDG